MLTFEEKRRQQFITEDYYLRTINYFQESIEIFENSDAFEDNEITMESGEAAKLKLIADTFYDMLFLMYTAGNPIEEVSKLFPIFINYKDKEAIAQAKFENNYRNDVLGNIEKSLPIISLAYLLDHKELLPQITLLLDGEREKRGGNSVIDAMIARFLRVNNSSQPVLNYEEPNALYRPSHHWMWCKMLDESAKKDVKQEALKWLDEYLNDWYSNQKFESWYNSHTRMENEVGYVGYWAFEAAAMVYFLDLDDSSLHKYLYYPKDIVAWIRQKHPITQDTKKEVFETIVLQENETAQSTGYYQDAITKRVVYLKQGEIAPAYPSDTDVTYARSYMWYKLTDYGVSLIPTETLNQLKK